MEYLPGGDLYSVFQNVGSLDEDTAKIYAAQIVSALEFLRISRVIHRDLKPDNILVGLNGRLKLADFGLSYFGVFDRSINANGTNTTFDDVFVGTPDYTAPEMVLSQPHTFTADYWAVGALLFEFLTGHPPFHGRTPAETFQNIVRGQYSVDKLQTVSPEVCDLIEKLLCLDPRQRLGAGSIDEIKRHAWFAGIDWDHLDEIEPPFVPTLGNDFDTSYFEERFSLQNQDAHDILDDIRLVSNSGKKKFPFCPLVDDDLEEDEMETFPSVAVHRLRETTDENARQLRLSQGSCDCETDDDASSPSFVRSPHDAALTPVTKKLRRPVSRRSFSPQCKVSNGISAMISVMSPAESETDET
jgi:serine/threonine protein kinase